MKNRKRVWTEPRHEHASVVPDVSGGTVASSRARAETFEQAWYGDELSERAGRMFRTFRSEWRIVAIVAIAVTAAAWIYAVVQPKQYRATALAAVTPVTSGLDPGDVIRGVETLERRTIVASIAAIAGTPMLKRQAFAGLLPGGTDDGYTIEAVVLPNTNLVQVSVEGTDRTRVAAAANRIPALLAQQTRSIYRYYGVTVVSPASPADEPFEPRTGRIAAAGLFLGILAGGFAAQRKALKRAAVQVP